MFYSYFWLYKFYKKKQLNASKIDSYIFLQNMHDLYFSQKLYINNRSKKLESYFSDAYSIYYAFSKKSTF
jgi:hypothetical protein